MTTEEIISQFRLYVDDTSELSSTEELTLANKIYQKVCNERPWEFLKTTATGTQSTSVPYVALPADFAYLYPNAQYTEMFDTYTGGSAPCVVFVGTQMTPYMVVNWSDRRQYRNRNNVAYIDVPNSRLYFANQPTSADSYEFDYISVPTALTLGTSPIFPARFHHVIYHGMAIDNDILQRYDKARSYAAVNETSYLDWLQQMQYWNSRLNQY